jgi:hypothetical protein
MYWVMGSMDNDTKTPTPVPPSPSTPPVGRAAASPGQPRSRVRPKDLHRFVEKLIGDDFHAMRVLSVANGLNGVFHAATLSIHAIGAALAQAQDLNPKHATKQVDRLLSNAGIDLEGFFVNWVPFVLAQRPEALLSLDWTEFDADDQSTICLSLVTSHGRATPLIWKTVVKSKLKKRRNDHEDAVLALFAELRPQTLNQATVLADRGFGDQKLYEFLTELGLDFIIRFRGVVLVEVASGECRPAKQWLPKTTRPRHISNPLVTADKTQVAAVVCVHAKGMKDPWFLATSRADLAGSKVIKCYGRRFTCEENFRDTKDIRFGMALSSTHISIPDRRDRLLMLGAMAQALLTLLGAAGERVGLDRMLKVNTVKRRTMSLFRQGSYWYGAIPAMSEEKLKLLMNAYAEVVAEHAVFAELFGVI